MAITATLTVTPIFNQMAYAGAGTGGGVVRAPHQPKQPAKAQLRPQLAAAAAAAAAVQVEAPVAASVAQHQRQR